MPRPRTLTGEKLARAKEWYARYVITPPFKTVAGELGVSEDVLRRAVRGDYKPAKAAP